MLHHSGNGTFGVQSERSLNASLGQLRLILRGGPIMNRFKNYTHILGKLNITEEDLDYMNNFNTETALPVCYCSGPIRELAQSYKRYHGYVALMVCIFGTVANVLNVVVLTRKDMAAAPINRILTGLAIADMLVMVEYIPFAVYEYFVLPERQMFPYGFAVFVLFHMHFTQLLHTISIALTLTLAVWRYIAIRFPEYNHSWCTAARCRLALWSSFLAPMIACAPSYLVFGIKEKKVYENGKEELLYHVDNYSRKRILYQLNFWVLGVVVKLIPCVILTVISCWLIKALYRVKGRKQVLRGYNPCVATNNGPVSRRPSKSERRADRTTRMLVAVLLLFLVTEIPQGVLGLLSGVLGDCFFRNCYHNFGEIMDILALLNGAINFILYCSMSRQFRTTFGQLFKPRIMKKWQPATQQTDVQSTYV
ncbi:G-protein coupled receptor dmsr-1 [Venturia canescens]|uniref:G-protein coupled receptor dmsr-1 n=1 Tax=Venturia canescens TaxID=32260 RepID=UPI001C9CA429|nr:G-protein coupled receptor dmsr-1 [Venturia canescens]XP_043277629.1 G-protein coupled receptor dmsr-1 [Venturia canescens]